MGVFSKAVEGYEQKRAQKRALVHDLRMGYCEPAPGTTTEEAIKTLLQDIADYDEVIRRFRGRDYA